MTALLGALLGLWVAYAVYAALRESWREWRQRLEREAVPYDGE